MHRYNGGKDKNKNIKFNDDFCFAFGPLPVKI